MNIRFTGPGDTPERMDAIKNCLPSQTIISSILEPVIDKKLFSVIEKCIITELEVYRNYPKRVLIEKTEAKEAVKSFDPTNNETCFMGKGFRHNADLIDSELADYRRAVGTIIHPVWGNCTLLEIWGGDHFEEHNKMVTDAFKYGMNLISTRPKIKIHVNPLFQNKKSKQFKLSDKQKEYQEQMELLMTKAMIFGVNEPKKSKPRRRKFIN